MFILFLDGELVRSKQKLELSKSTSFMSDVNEQSDILYIKDRQFPPANQSSRKGS